MVIKLIYQEICEKKKKKNEDYLKHDPDKSPEFENVAGNSNTELKKKETQSDVQLFVTKEN